jgi:hypothetical protein
MEQKIEVEVRYVEDGRTADRRKVAAALARLLLAVYEQQERLASASEAA